MQVFRKLLNRNESWMAKKPDLELRHSFSRIHHGMFD